MRRSFFRMHPKSQTPYTQWMRDVWANKFLFWSVIFGFVTVFPVVCPFVTVGELALTPYLYLTIDLYPCHQRQSLQTRTHLLGMGHRVYYRLPVHGFS